MEALILQYIALIATRAHIHDYYILLAPYELSVLHTSALTEPPATAPAAVDEEIAAALGGLGHGREHTRGTDTALSPRIH